MYFCRKIPIIYGKRFISGQYLDYRSALEDFEPERTVYLALPTHAYNHTVFQGRFIQKRLREENAQLIIFEPVKNEIIQWIKL